MSRDPITTYRYGTPRSRDELLRIGVTRHPPRGVSREERQRLGYWDTWLPLLAPSAELLASYRKGEIAFEKLAERYRVEMRRPESRQVIELLAALLPFQTISLGCFCEDETRCHRTILRELILTEAKARAATLFAPDAPPAEPREHFASPVCYAFEEREPLPEPPSHPAEE